jgi:sulfate-transporting ATPase
VIVILIRFPEGLAAGGHELARRARRVRRLRRVRPAAVRPRTARRDQPPSSPGVEAKPVADGPVFAVEHLSVHYGGVTAVSDVSLRIDPGQVVGLIGPNGAGKTSLIDAVTGFAPAEGEVYLNGERIDGLPAHARARIGVARTFQSLELYDELTVEENVSAAAFGTAREDRRHQVAGALQRVGLGAEGERRAGELSQSERQLVSIARACVREPTVLLLDEPAAGLDPADSKRLAVRIRDIAAAGTGVLLVDHDVGLVLGVCDHVYVLDFGALIADGDAGTIRADPAVADVYLGSLHGTFPAP